MLGLAEPYYRVCENSGTLAVKLTRTGSSRDLAFVGIKVQEISARLGMDSTHSSASLVQFDPGVSTKLWNIYLKNDGLEENNEFLKILLKTPKNAVLGRNSEATVEIMDPRGGQCRARNVNTREVSLHAGHVGSPARQHLSNDREKSSYDAGISSPKITQILLPNTRASEHSRSHLNHSGLDSGSELPSRRPGQQLHLPGSSVLVRSFNFLKRKKGRKKKALITLGINEKYHGIIPMSGPQPTNRRGDVWLVGAGPSLSQDPEERPLQDSAPLDSVHKSSNETQQIRA
ncbi:FRAS1-related extracellular matrix protein 1-like isoform X1 [Pseudophryne corroboree]|uniref:FRAS1-related extracellular matrix protein 1-like isoform X1 n=1 Tax=Pseudophryne corroboree TaxID=495146 RepID=UPI0030816419